MDPAVLAIVPETFGTAGSNNSKNAQIIDPFSHLPTTRTLSPTLNGTLCGLPIQSKFEYIAQRSLRLIVICHR